MRYLEAIRKLCFAQVTHHDNPVYPYNLLHAIAININLHIGVTIARCATCPLKTALAGTWHGILRNF